MYLDVLKKLVQESKVSDELTNELERSPSISEIAQRLEVSDEEVWKRWRWVRVTMP